MSTKSTVALLSVGFLSFAAISAPLSATAKTQTRPQAQHQQGSQGRVEQRPTQNADAQPGSNQSRQQTSAGRYRITSTVSIRSGAGTNFRRLGQMTAGRTVQVDQVRNGWLHVHGQGWISAQFARRT